MKIVKRFDLNVEPRQVVDIPFNSEYLGFGTFNSRPCLWVLVDTAQKIIQRTFLIVAEDKEVSERSNKSNYLGNFEAKAEVGKHVFHVFEE